MAMRQYTFSWMVLALAITSLPVAAWAQLQSAAQQSCINAINKAGAKVSKAQGKENANCVKGTMRGKIPIAEVCLLADAKGRIGKAKAMTVDTEAKACTIETPDFGYSSAALVNAVAVNGEVALLHDIFGPDLDAALLNVFTDPGGAFCQAAVIKDYEKLLAIKIREFITCKRNGLKGQSIQSAADLEGCFDAVLASGGAGGDSAHPLAKPGKVFKALQKLEADLERRCGPVLSVLDSLFPGRCVGAPFLTCVDERVECRFCLMINAMDGLSRDCDLFDDGAINSSCPPP